MRIPIYQIDAFANEQFKGNPAAVCPLEKWLDDSTMLNIAKENNLSETAFFVKRDNYYELKWFTPEYEIDLCGHATLASAFVIFNYLDKNIDRVKFETKSGSLEVFKDGGLLSMIFPARPGERCEIIPGALALGLGKRPMALYKSRDFLAVFENEEDIKHLKLDIDELKKLDALGIIVTAKSDEFDFVSRFFSPNSGIIEDPVTGSSHCTLVPYWARIFNKNVLKAYQASERGGILHCEYMDDKVKISGEAVAYLEGYINIKERG